MANLDLVRKDDVSSFRKIAIGTWRDAYDPSVYGTMELRMDEAMRYIEAFRAKTGKKLTVVAHDGQGGRHGAQADARRQRHPALEPHLPAQAHRHLLPGGA